jgi:hypothetical protein
MMTLCKGGCEARTTRANGYCRHCDTARWARIQDMCQGSVKDAAARHGVSYHHVASVRALVRDGHLLPPTAERKEKAANGDSAAMYRKWLALYNRGMARHEIAKQCQRPLKHIYDGISAARKERKSGTH